MVLLWNSAYLPSVDGNEVWKVIDTFSLVKPACYDRLRLQDIKYNYCKLKDLLVFIFNGCFETGVIPQGMKVSVIRPIHKAGRKADKNNYRPISIIPVLSLIMEKLVHKSMTSFCDRFSIISTTQYGFRSGLSTIDLLEECSDYINKHIDQNKIVIGLFLDLTKAFDTIDQNIMLHKLENIGFRGPYQKFFTSYFADRIQVVGVKNVHSAFMHVKYGVPQGSVLGPLLFNIYVNDIAHLQLNAQLLQYADDTALILSRESYNEAIELLQNDVTKVVRWFDTNQIFLNKNKTTLICFRNPHKTIIRNGSIVLHSDYCKDCSCVPLQLSSTVKYLGLHFDEHMSWVLHVEYIIKRLRTVSAQLYKLKFSSALNLRRLVFKALGQSILRYGISVYGSCTQTRIHRIEKLLDRISSNILYGTDLETLNKGVKTYIAGVDSFVDLYNQVVLLRNFFCTRYKKVVKKPKVLRKTDRYELPRICTNYGKRCREYYVPFYFNQLPDDIERLCSINKAKSQIKHWLNYVK